MKKLFNRITVYLILIVLLAGILRVLRMIEENRYSVDAYLYFEMAEDWAYHGAEYTALYNANNIPPLLPWLMAIGYNFGIEPEHTGLILGILLGSLMPLTAFWIALTLFSRTKQENEDGNIIPGNYFYALLVAFLVATHPFLVRISVSCLREILYLPLISLAVAFAVSAIYNKSLWKWLAFAFLVALANTARREGISLIFIFFVWLAVEFAAERKSFVKNIKYYLAASAIIVFTFSVLTLLALYMLQGSLYTWNPFYINID